MSVFIPQGPLIPSSVKFSSGEFTKDLKVDGNLYANLASRSYFTTAPTSYTVPSVIQPLDILNGIISAQGEIILTFPTATDLIAAIPGVYIGQTFDFFVANTGADTVWFAPGTGCTINNSSYLSDDGSSMNVPLKIRINTLTTYIVY